MKTFSKDHNGIVKLLIYNDSILLLDRLSTTQIKINSPDHKLTFNLTFKFSDGGKKGTILRMISTNKKDLTYTLFQWDGPNFIEVIKPIEYTVLGTGKKFWIKFATKSNVQISSRTLNVSIWIEV